jgi:sulfofructose kinase
MGIIAVDEVLVVDAYPPPDTKTRVESWERHGGGLAGTALIAAARLGARCAYAGVLGEDELSCWSIENLEAAGVDCSRALRIPQARPFHAVIVVDQTAHTRTILFTQEGTEPRPVESIDEEFLVETGVLLIDHFGVDAMLRAAKIARQLGVPVVADIERDDEPNTHELVRTVDHLILSWDFAARFTGASRPEDAVQQLASDTQRACTAVTAGRDGAWYATDQEGGSIDHLPAFAVDVVDTTGCGDVFHGAYAAALAGGWEIRRSLQFAAAAAAIKATRPGGQQGAPDRATVERFLEDPC